MKSLRRRLLVACLGLLMATAANPALAAECTGAEVIELVRGCSILKGNEDFELRLYASGADLRTPQGIRNALNRTVVFVHGYGVSNTVLPKVLFEDGKDGAINALYAAGIG